MSTRKSKAPQPKSNWEKTSAKIILWIFYFLLLLGIGIVIITPTGKAHASQDIPNKVEPTEEEKQIAYAEQVNKLLAKAIKEDNAILVMCYNKTCYDTESNMRLPATGIDGYYLVYPTTSKGKDKIRSMVEQVKQLSSEARSKINR